MASFYDISIKPFLRGFTNLKAILQKAEEHSKTSGGPSTSELCQAKLADDMLPLTFQVQMMSNAAKFTAVRIGGVENVAFEDNEKTFEDLYVRIDRTVAFLESVKREQMDGKEKKEISFTLGYGTWKLSALDYLMQYSMANFSFHEVTAYAILRSKGVPVGKWDYLGRDLYNRKQ